MLEFQSLVENIHPGIFIHSVYVEEELDKDRQAGFVCLPCLSSTGKLIIKPWPVRECQ
jgi:hypothetical protein